MDFKALKAIAKSEGKLIATPLKAVINNNHRKTKKEKKHNYTTKIKQRRLTAITLQGATEKSLILQ